METSHKHFKIYKPYRMLSQFSSNAAKEQKKRFLSELGDFPQGIMPIGRLDEKSEGLLLLTTDGKLSNYVNQSGIEKEYYALVDGDISAKAIQQLSEGIELGFNGTTKPCKVTKLKELPDVPERSKKIRDARHGPTSWISVTLTEGKFRQVRKMTSAVNCPTLRLVRVRVGNITLDNMQVADVLAIKNLNQLL